MALTGFTTLPYELREQIWLMAIPEDTPEVCQLMTFAEAIKRSIEPRYRPFVVFTGFPKVMHICKESRSIALDRKRNTLRLRAAPGTDILVPYRAFRPEMDTMFCDGDVLSVLRLFYGHAVRYDSIQTLAVEARWMFHNARLFVRMMLPNMPNLKKVLLVMGDTQEETDIIYTIKLPSRRCELRPVALDKCHSIEFLGARHRIKRFLIEGTSDIPVPTYPVSLTRALEICKEGVEDLVYSYFPPHQVAPNEAGEDDEEEEEEEEEEWRDGDEDEEEDLETELQVLATTDTDSDSDSDSDAYYSDACSDIYTDAYSDIYADTIILETGTDIETGSETGAEMATETETETETDIWADVYSRIKTSTETGAETGAETDSESEAPIWNDAETEIWDDAYSAIWIPADSADVDFWTDLDIENDEPEPEPEPEPMELEDSEMMTRFHELEFEFQVLLEYQKDRTWTEVGSIGRPPIDDQYWHPCLTEIIIEKPLEPMEPPRIILYLLDVIIGIYNWWNIELIKKRKQKNTEEGIGLMMVEITGEAIQQRLDKWGFLLYHIGLLLV